MTERSPCNCGAQGDKCAPIAPRFHKPGCPHAAAGVEGTRILRVDLPPDQLLKTINQTVLVDHAKRVWDLAKSAGGDADAVGLIVTGPAFSFKAFEGINPRVFTSRVGSRWSTATICGSMIDDMRAEEDNVHLAVAAAALRRYLLEDIAVARQKRAEKPNP